MFVLYRTDGCPRCDDLADQLKEWVLAHRVVALTEATRPADLPLDAPPPILREGDHLIYGHALAPYLATLRRELSFSRSVSSDACYIDPDDPAHCV